MRNIKSTLSGYTFLIVIGLLVACAGVSPDTGAAPTQPAETLTSRIDQYVRTHYPGFSGVILIARQGTVLINWGYGFANQELDVPNTPQTKFSIASLTKAFTAMAIMILQERGQLKVQDSICKYILDCPTTWTPITLHHLLTHTSGIRNYSDLYDKVNLYQEYTPEEITVSFKDLPLDFSPGSQWNYSNSGYFLLGVVIEKASGERYETYIQRSIFQPLGMSESGYNRSTTIVKNRASGYTLNLAAQLINTFPRDVSQRYAAGGLYSTVGDLLKWDQALYTNQLVSTESLSAIFAPSASLPNGVGYGYGWMISDRSGYHIVEHGGAVPGFVANLARYPDDQVTIIVLSNFDVYNPAQISDGLAEIVFKEK
jgi:CubicO group peptidase (beta-lactamase class C family)